MDTSLSCLDLAEAEFSSSSPLPPIVIETQKPSEQERQLASKASLAYFTKKNYSEALAWLENLFVLRPNDPRVCGNLALVNFLVEGGGFNELAKMQNNLKNMYMNLLTGSGGEFEESELPVLIYNMALCAYFQKQFIIAEKLLEQIYLSLTSFPPSPSSGPTSPSHNTQAFKFKHLLPLLTSVCLALNKPSQALAYLNEAETLSRQLDEDNSFGPRSVLFRGHAFVLSKQHKTFKRDLKSTGLSPEQSTTYEFLRSNLEFLKGNHRKAMKLLALALQQQPAEKLTSRLGSMFENNLGCLHLMLGKPNLGVFYFSQALQQHETYFGELKQEKPVRKDAALNIKQTEVIYNLGLALLHAGQPEKAFQSFTKCLPVFEMNASLWLHLAECCIQATKLTYSHDVKYFYGKSNIDQDNVSTAETVIGTVGTGIHRKFVLKPASISNKKPELSANPELNLEYAAQCLRNALAFSNHLVVGEKRNSASPRGNGNTSSSANSSAQTSPVKSASPFDKIVLLRASILVDSAYVALCLANPVAALDFSEKFLEFNKNGNLPNGYKMLAHLYAAEALIQLSRISEATEHLDPSNIQDISFSDVIVDSNEDPSSSKNLDSVRNVFHFNLIVAFALRGELDKAESLLEKLWLENRAQDRFGIHLQLLTLRMYIQLAKGNVERCRQLAIKHCYIVQQK